MPHASVSRREAFCLLWALRVIVASKNVQRYTIVLILCSSLVTRMSSSVGLLNSFPVTCKKTPYSRISVRTLPRTTAAIGKGGALAIRRYV